jgi:benzoate-CoA ligase
VKAGLLRSSAAIIACKKTEVSLQVVETHKNCTLMHFLTPKPFTISKKEYAMTISTPNQTPTTPTERFNFSQWLIETNANRPNKAACIDDQGSLSYEQLTQRIQLFAGALVAAGIRREERVLLAMHDCNDWPVAFLGAIYAGVVPVAVNTLLTVDDYAYMLANCRAQAVITSGALLATVNGAMAVSETSNTNEVRTVIVSNPVGELNSAINFATFTTSAKPQAAPAKTGRDDPAFWLYSSGSTGKPKGTVHTHANPYWTAVLYTPVLGMVESDVCFSAAKLFFAYGLGNGLSFPFSVGATALYMAERPTPDAVFKRWTGGVAASKPTIFFGAPTGFAGMLASPNLPKKADIALRLTSSAGEALPAELGQKFTAQYGVEIVDGIGSTEMLHIFLSNQPGKVRYGTTGWPVPGYSVELRGEDGLSVADGEIGDLYIQGPSSALCYWGNREKSSDTFQGAWTKSGDKYVKNNDGTYTYSGRSDDMLKVSGIYVSPFEVESTLMQHDAVLEAAVIGKEDADGLTKTKAFVVLKAGKTTDETELKAFVKERLAAYKYPRFIEFIAELPKTATGKIQRFKLRDLEKHANH